MEDDHATERQLHEYAVRNEVAIPERVPCNGCEHCREYYHEGAGDLRIAHMIRQFHAKQLEQNIACKQESDPKPAVAQGCHNE